MNLKFRMLFKVQLLLVIRIILWPCVNCILGYLAHPTNLKQEILTQEQVEKRAVFPVFCLLIMNPHLTRKIPSPLMDKAFRLCESISELKLV